MLMKGGCCYIPLAMPFKQRQALKRVLFNRKIRADGEGICRWVEETHRKRLEIYLVEIGPRMPRNKFPRSD